MSQAKAASILLSLTLVAGCVESPSDLGWEGVVAPIALSGVTEVTREDDGEARSVELPWVGIETSGSNVAVTVMTFGPAACAAPQRVAVQLEGTRAVVTPYLRVRTEDRGCPGALVSFDQTAIIEFADPGTATVVVRGMDDHDRETAEMIEVERTVELSGG